MASGNTSSLIRRTDVFKRRHPKTNTGCWTCRQRHLKCDEAKPNCRRCLRDGKVCQGYPSIRTLNFEILSNAKEMRSYHYFNEQVAAGLSGQYNWEFWTVAIKQVSSMNVALQHAMAALGSLHEAGQRTSLRDSTEAKAFAIVQYDKAIRNLTVSSTSDLGVIVHICFILFITIELQLGDVDQAISLLRNELNLLRQSQHPFPGSLQTATEKSLFQKFLGPMLIRFWLQLGLEKDAMARTVMALEDLRLNETSEQRSVTFFKDMNQAKEALQRILETTFSSMHVQAVRKDVERLEAIAQQGRARLTSWKVAFSTTKEMWHTEQSTVLLLQIQSRTAELILRTVISTRDLASNEEFRHQVEACEQFLCLNLHDQHSVFFMDHAVIQALFFTAVRCRDPAISERALLLLESNVWQEGFWRSTQVASAARDLIEEERQLRLSNQAVSAPSSGSDASSIFAPKQPFEGCAWEFLGGQKLIITNTNPFDQHYPSVSEPSDAAYVQDYFI